MSGPRATVLTAASRGAVAVVRVWGEGAIEAAEAVFRPNGGRSLSETPVGRLRVGRVGSGEGDEVVAVRLEGGEVEFQGHGGPAAVRLVLEALKGVGVQGAPASEWLANEGRSRIRVEALEDLARTETVRAAEILLEQSEGALEAELGWVASLIERLSPGGEPGSRGCHGWGPKTDPRHPETISRQNSRAFPPESHLAGGASEDSGRGRPVAPEAGGDLQGEGLQAEAVAVLDVLLDRARVGRKLVTGWTVALAGRPNVGKSRLLNALAGFERAIVDPTPGTTRDVVTLRTALGGWPVELADTAGLRESDDPIEAAGVARARAIQRGADLVVLVLDGSEPLTEADARMIEAFPDALRVANKSDLPAAWSAQETGARAISAEWGDGLEDLVRDLAERLVPEAPPEGAGVPFREWQVRVIERVRRRLMEGRGDRAARLLERLGKR